LVVIDTCLANLNFIDVRLGVIEFTIVGAHRETVKIVFIGYPEGMKGYKLWKLESDGGSRVMINRDVTFDETRMGMKCKDLETLEPKTRVMEV